MSRTFRRKDLEICRPHYHGIKVAGYYTISEYNTLYASFYTFRAPTKHERDAAYWKNHRDSHSNYWGPGKEYRHNRMTQNRVINKNEIAKWIKNPDYEPLCEADPRDNAWDYD